MKPLFTGESRSSVGSRSGYGTSQSSVDPYVQEWVAGTNGRLYIPLIGRLIRYPIPIWPGPRALKPGSMLLDVGCGWGRWMVSAAQAGYVPVGIDEKPEAVQAALRVMRAHGLPGYGIVARLDRLPFRSLAFDNVFSYSVVQHVHKRLAVRGILEAWRILRPGGTAMIEFPLASGISNWRHRASYPESLEETSGCVRYYRTGELRALFRDAFGNVRFDADCFFGIGVRWEDVDLLPLKFKIVALLSRFMVAATNFLPFLRSFSDSVYVTAQKCSIVTEHQDSVRLTDPSDQISQLLPILRCPLSGGALQHDEQTDVLISVEGRVKYPIICGIPTLTLEAARPLTDSEI